MAYFDQAATTYPKPQCVYDFMDHFYRTAGGSVGRGSYALSLSAKELIEGTRYELQKLLCCENKQIIFEPSDTICLNIIIQGLIKAGARNIYISPFEHNAVTRTLHNFSEQGDIFVYQLHVSENLQYDLQRIQYQFDENRPDAIIVSHASNVIGLVAPVEELFQVAKRYGATTVLDMAQTAGLVSCNLKSDIYDFVVFAGHKTLLGPTGISGFIMKPGFDLPPVIFGGTGYDSANQDMPDSIPEKFEMGTMNISGIAGLNAALNWIAQKGMDYLYANEIDKRKRLIEILSEYDFISIIGNKVDCKYVGIVSCLIDGISSDTAGQLFSERNIAVRTGLQCAPLAHKFLGTFPAGTIRFSVNHSTSEGDFEELVKALNDIEENL